MGLVAALLSIRRELLERARREGFWIAEDPESRALVERDDMAFLIGAISTRGVRASAAWRVPLELLRRLGHLDPRRIMAMDVEDLARALSEPAPAHRWPNRLAESVRDLCRVVVEGLGGDPSALWRLGDAGEMLRVLGMVKGVGPKISSMVINLRVAFFGLKARGLEVVDISPDVHVRRVFRRLGLVGPEDDADAVVARARALHPDYPGALDLPVWYVGRTWCREGTPECQGCPLRDHCPVTKQVQLH